MLEDVRFDTRNAKKMAALRDSQRVALSKERFQFIFKHEHDLLDIMNRGFHNFYLLYIVM